MCLCNQPENVNLVTTQKEAICHLASSFDNLQKSQEKHMEMWAEAECKRAEAECKREETYLQYQEKLVELNKQHKLCLMEIMVRSQNPIQAQQQPQQQYPQAYSQ